MELSKGKLLNIYERMLSIRNFDLKVNQLEIKISYTEYL